MVIGAHIILTNNCVCVCVLLMHEGGHRHCAVQCRGDGGATLEGVAPVHSHHWGLAAAHCHHLLQPSVSHLSVETILAHILESLVSLSN